MRNEVIQFKGIVRSTSGQVAGEGACEELINVRNQGEHLRVVGKKKTIIANTEFKKYILHKIADQENHIAFYDNMVYHINPDTLGVIDDLYAASGDVDLYSLNNMLIINDTVAEKMIVYEWIDNAYVLHFNGLPVSTSLTITKENFTMGPVDFNIPTATGYSDIDSVDAPKYILSDVFSCDVDSYIDEKQFRETVLSAINNARILNKEFTEGYVLLATNFTLINGEETKMSNPIMVELGEFIKYPMIYFAATYDTRIALKAQRLKVSLSGADGLSTYRKLIKAVNIYASLPVSHYSLEIHEIPKFPRTADQHTYAVITQQGFLGFNTNVVNTEKLSKLLMFKQHSIPLTNIEASYTINFGASQATEKTMPVDNSGWLKSSGRAFLFNNRLHLYDYKRIFTKEANIFSRMDFFGMAELGYEIAQITAQFTINASNKVLSASGLVTALVKYAADGESAQIWLQDFISFPDSRAESVTLSWTNSSTSKKYTKTIVLNPSKTLNFAFAYVKTSAEIPFATCNRVDALTTIADSLKIEENTIVLVSSPGAPYHFPVEHSYRIGGEIQDLALMVEQVSEAQQGQYPLVVFTDRGIYALQQGSGLVLYSNLIPISNDTCKRGVVQTKSGVAYIANNSVNLLYGRSGINISKALEADIDKSIRFCNSFSLATKNIALYDIYDYLSKVDFRNYIQGANLFFDSVQEEIIVSNTDYLYSYVFNLREKLWHKITEIFKEGNNRYALRPTTATLQPALPATATIEIPAIVVSPEVQFASQNKCSLSAMDAVIPAGQQLQLIVDSSRLSSYHTQVAMPTYMALEMMLSVIPFIKMNYNSSTKVVDIYSSKAEHAGKVLALKNTTTASEKTATLTTYAQSVTITAKGIGQTIIATINAINAQISILSTDDYISITERLKAAIVDAVSTVTVSNYMNLLTISTKATGAAQNNVTIAITPSLHIMMVKTNFTGGRDAGAASIEDSPADIVDLSEEEMEGSNLIHIQTRPNQLNQFGYKKIERAVLRGEIRPSGRPFGAYLFASNDLVTWKLVTGVQTDSNLANLRMQRSKLSYRYYQLVSGGSVDILNDIVLLDMQVEDVLEKKIR